MGRLRDNTRPGFTLDGSGGMSENAPSHPLSEHSIGNRIARFLWSVTYVILFRHTPRPFHAWRNLLLRIFGAKIHRTARVYPKVKIWFPGNLVMGVGTCMGDAVDCYNVATITLEDGATVSQYSYLCGATHNPDDVNFPLVPLPITICRRAWLAADVFVAPGVTIGEGCGRGGAILGFQGSSALANLRGNPGAAGPAPRRGSGRLHGSR